MVVFDDFNKLQKVKMQKAQQLRSHKWVSNQQPKAVSLQIAQHDITNNLQLQAIKIISIFIICRLFSPDLRTKRSFFHSAEISVKKKKKAGGFISSVNILRDS